MESDGSRWLLCICILICAVIFKGFMTACETAVIEISDTKVKSLSDKNRKEKILAGLLSKPARLITAFSVNRAFTGVIIAILSAISFIRPLEKLFVKFYSLFTEMSKAVFAEITAVIISILLTTVLMVALCDIFPKKLVSGHYEEFALSTAGFVRAVQIFLTPLTALTYGIVYVFCKIFGISINNKQDAVTEEEILMMVDAGNETGVLEESQKEMINNIFDFKDLAISDVMTHRTEMKAIEVSSKITDAVNTAIETGYSRIPVYENDIDNIIGILNVKDLLCLVECQSTDGFTVRDFLRKVEFFPETNTCSDVFKKMTALKAQVAVAVDEYGGTAGIVTIEDLVESIVGNMQDEYDNETEDCIKISDNTFIISGMAEPENIIEELGEKLPEDNDYDTMSGFIIDLLGRIPDDEENPKVVYKNIEFTVLLVEEKKVSKLKAVVEAE